jgi:hypothetical protein
MLAIVRHLEYYKLGEQKVIPYLIPLIVGIRRPLCRLPCYIPCAKNISPRSKTGQQLIEIQFKEPFLLYHTTPFNLIDQVSRLRYIEGL